MARRDTEIVRTGLAKVGANRANQRVPARSVTTRVQETSASRAARGLPPVGVTRTTGGAINLGGNQ